MAGQAQPAPALQLTMYPCTESATIQHGINSALLPSTMGLHSANCPITGEPTLFSIHHPCNSQQLSLPRCVQGLPFAPAQVPFCFSATNRPAICTSSACHPTLLSCCQGPAICYQNLQHLLLPTIYNKHAYSIYYVCTYIIIIYFLFFNLLACLQKETFYIHVHK